MKNKVIIILISALSLLNATDLLPLPKDFQRNPQLYINKIDIDAELCGPLMKSIIEIEFYNPYDKDSLETRQSFFSDSESFVKDLWLDINGEYKKAETYTSAAGSEIYDLTVYGKRLDPAILSTEGKGRYNLKVFPFLKGQSRKVKMEMYSFLIENDSSEYEWKFSPYLSDKINKDYTVNFRLKYFLPEGTCIIINNDSIKAKENIVDKRLTNKAVLKFILADNFKPMCLINDNNNYLWNIKTDNLKYKDVSIVQFSSSIQEPLALLTENTKNGISTLIKADSSNFENTIFFDYIKFLIKKKNAQINFTGDHGEHSLNCEMRDGKVEFTKSKTLKNEYILERILSEIGNCPNTAKKIVCNFVDQYVMFYSLSKKSIKVHVENELLTPFTRKLVLEENEKINQIKDAALKKQDKLLETPYYQNDQEDRKKYEDEIFDFFSVQDRPILIQNMSKLIQNYVHRKYPIEAKNKKISGKVIIKLIQSIDGLADNVSITMEKPADFGFGKVAADALRLFGRFQYKDRHYGTIKPTRISQKIDFNYKKYSEDKGIVSLMQVDLIKRKFDLDYSDTVSADKICLVETGYKKQKAISIKYRSDEFYEFIYQNPEYIELITWRIDIIFKHKNKWYRIIQ